MVGNKGGGYGGKGGGGKGSGGMPPDYSGKGGGKSTHVPRPAVGILPKATVEGPSKSELNAFRLVQEELDKERERNKKQSAELKELRHFKGEFESLTGVVKLLRWPFLPHCLRLCLPAPMYLSRSTFFRRTRNAELLKEVSEAEANKKRISGIFQGSYPSLDM